MATMFSLWLAREDGESLLCDHNDDDIGIDEQIFETLIQEAAIRVADKTGKQILSSCYLNYDDYEEDYGLWHSDDGGDDGGGDDGGGGDGGGDGDGDDGGDDDGDVYDEYNSTPNIRRCIDIGIDEQIFETLIQEAAIRIADKTGKQILPSCYLNYDDYKEEYGLWHTDDDDDDVDDDGDGDDGDDGGDNDDYDDNDGDDDDYDDYYVDDYDDYDEYYSTPNIRRCIDIGIDEQIFETVIHGAAISSSRWGKLGPYSWEQKILVVGDGDFSFSASLAVAFGDASNMIATSLDSFEFLMQNYARAVNNILELTSKSCKVMHGVDATKMANHPKLHSLKFDCIVYNFPHAGFSNRNASREAQIRMHQKLVRGFLENAKKMIKDDGQIHITHKCVGFFQEWNLETLGSSQGLRLVEESPFNLQQYPGYETKYGYGGDANFNCRPAKTYKFQLARVDFKLP